MDTALTPNLDPLAIAEAWKKAGRDVAIATVVETWGSAPRPVGSHLVIDADGNFDGSVSGGCVEGAVVAEAIDVIGDGKPRCWNSASPTKPPGASACPAAAASGSMSSGSAEAMDLALSNALNAERRRAPGGGPGHRPRRRRGARWCARASDDRRRRSARRSRRRSAPAVRGTVEAGRRQLFLNVERAAAAPGGDRRRPYQPGAGADGDGRRLRRRGHRPAHRLRDAGAVSRRAAHRRLAGDAC